MSKETDSSGIARYVERAEEWIKNVGAYSAYEHDSHDIRENAEDLAVVLNQIRRETIEECAKVCDERAGAESDWMYSKRIGALWLAARIRALAPFTSDGEKP